MIFAAVCGTTDTEVGTWFFSLRVCARQFDMKLADYMHRTGLTPGKLRVMLGVKSRTTVLRYIKGERTPEGPILERIEQLSGGLVTLRDFLDPEPPACARVVIDRFGQPHIVYPWTNIEQHRQARAANDNQPPGMPRLVIPRDPPDASGGGPSRPESYADPWPSRPLRTALDELGTRVRPSVRGNFLLDGRQVDARKIVAEANRLRRLAGRPPIPYPGVEPLT